MSSERDVVLNKWMECFKALLNRDSSKSNLLPSPRAKIDVIPDSDQLNEPITREEVIQALKTAPTKNLKLWELIALIQAIYSMNQLLASLFTCLITVLRIVCAPRLGGKLLSS